MAVFKRGTVYWMQFTFQGRRIQKSTHCKNKREAEEIERAFRIQLAKGEVGIEERKPIPLFSEAMDKFLTWSKAEHLDKPNTNKRKETASKPLLKFFENKKLDKITVDDVENYKHWRIKQKKQAPNKKLQKNKNAKTNIKLKPATVNRELACLRAMYNYFIKNDVITKNPVSRVKFFKENNESTRVISREEERLYLVACSQPLRDVAILMVETGMRPEEVFRMEVKNVNVEKGYINIPFGKTKAARRKIPLSKRAKEVLRYRLEMIEGKFVFPGMKAAKNAHTHIVKLNNSHRGAIKRSTVEQFRLYDLRHTFATRAVEAGVDLVTLASLMGHSRIQMVMRYAHPTEQHQINAIRKIELARSNVA